jgi:hypothetical protein
MSIKSKRTKKHRRNYKRNTSRKPKTHRKRLEVLTLPGSKGLPLFSVPINKQQKRVVNMNTKQTGNMIFGLRDM